VNVGLLLLTITIATALTFDFLNGFHDSANSIATVVSTRVLSPKLAVLWAAFFNFVAAFLLGTAVAKMIGKGMIHLDMVTQYVVIAGLTGAIVWDLLTGYLGLPTSSSRALIGGYAGAAMARHMSAEARRRIGLAMKKRWTARKKAAAPCPITAS
jgi:PiT family inorganic phosphate transporter